MSKRICVIDGQGGGIGAYLIKHLREIYGASVEIDALGSNDIATSQMLKAGANRGASGENAIARTVAEADVILGPIAITWPNSMMGEITPRIAQAVMSVPAVKILLPLNQEHVIIAGCSKEPLPHIIKFLEEELQKVLNRG